MDEEVDEVVDEEVVDEDKKFVPGAKFLVLAKSGESGKLELVSGSRTAVFAWFLGPSVLFCFKIGVI